MGADFLCEPLQRMMGDTSLLLMIVMPFVGSLIAGLLPSNARNAEVWLAGAVALGELRQSIGSARRTRQHRLAGQIVRDVVGEVGDRLVAAGAVLLQALEHDPVEVAAEAPQ